MEKAARVLRRFFSDERGLETVEYAVIGAFIVIGTAATIGFLLVALNQKFADLQTSIEATPSG